MHPVSILVVCITYIIGLVFGYKGLNGALMTIRTVTLIIGQFFGIMGIIVEATIVFLYMANLKAIGVPYLSPYVPLRIMELKDSLYRGDLKVLINSQHRYRKE